MDQARLNILESLFHEAMALAPPQRAAFADLACSGDEPLRQVLRAWLDEAQSVPAHAAAVVAAPLPIMTATTTNSLHDALTTAPPQAVVETDDIPPARHGFCRYRIEDQGISDCQVKGVR